MRRHDKEILETAAIEDIIQRACICHLGLSDKGTPYVLPMCFAYHDRTFFFHSASEGRKMDVLRRNPNVCISVVSDYDMVTAPKACSFSMRYESVIGFGQAQFIEDPTQKRFALDRILRRYGGGTISTDYPEEALARTVVFSVFCDTLTAKVSG